MNVLLIGAGAIGQTYGLVLQRGGASVSYYVRPRRREEALRGYAVHELSARGRVKSTQVVPAHVVTSVAEVREHAWDQVWITVPANVLEEPWLQELVDACADATVIMLQPGLKNRALVASWCGEERLVVGLITFIAWHSPLPGEELPVGMALYVPPLAPVPFSGARATSVVRLFRRGGARAQRIRDVARRAAFGAALLQTMIAALECAGWSFAALLSRTHASRAVAAAKEAAAVASAVVGDRPPLLLFGLTPTTLRMGLAVARRVLPFDLEVYLQAHFTKVGEQTAFAIDELLSQAQANDVAVPRLRELAEEFRALRRQTSATSAETATDDNPRAPSLSAP